MVTLEFLEVDVETRSGGNGWWTICISTTVILRSCFGVAGKKAFRLAREEPPAMVVTVEMLKEVLTT